MNSRLSFINGVKWNSISTISLSTVGIIKIAVLTRFLDGREFGLFAILTFIIGILNLFMDFGLSSAIIHKLKINIKECSSLYWTNVFISLGLYFIVYNLSPVISKFYQEEKLMEIIPIISISILLAAVGNQFRVMFQKNMNFKVIMLIENTGSLIGFISAVVCAVKGLGIYSLVISTVAQYAINNLLYLVMGIKIFPILFHYSYTETKPFLKIGVFQFGSQIINYFNKELDLILIGKFFGTELLGFYHLAKQLASKPATIINPLLTKVATPFFSKFQKNIKDLKIRYLEILNLISTLNFIAYFILFISSKQLILLFYGEGYILLTDYVRYFSAYMFLRSLGNPIGSLTISLGETRLEFMWNIFVLCLIPMIIFFSAQYSVEMVLISLILAMLLLNFLSWKVLLNRLIIVGIREYLDAILPKPNSTLKRILNFRRDPI